VLVGRAVALGRHERDLEVAALHAAQDLPSADLAAFVGGEQEAR
jgi:hypothetical protein